MKVKKNILVVDDEPRIVELISNYLKKLDFFIFEASNGLEAESIFIKEQIDLILSDIRMPTMDGIALLKSVKKSKKPVKFILMTGFKEILETKAAFDLGADDFLSKPFRINDLKNSVINLLNNSKEKISQNLQNLDELFVGISIDEFLYGKKIKYPIFLRLSSEKFVKVAECGDRIPIDQIQRYKKKNVNQLFLKKIDFKQYAEMSEKILKAISTTNQNIPSEAKYELFIKSSLTVVNSLFVKGTDEKTFNSSKEIVDSSIKFLAQQNDFFKILNVMLNNNEKIYAHSISVMTMSIMICSKLNWNSQRNHILISMGALIL